MCVYVCSISVSLWLVKHHLIQSKIHGAEIFCGFCDCLDTKKLAAHGSRFKSILCLKQKTAYALVSEGYDFVRKQVNKQKKSQKKPPPLSKMVTF